MSKVLTGTLRSFKIINKVGKKHYDNILEYIDELLNTVYL